MHKICLAHMERDNAAGGNLYAKFARCYLQLAGREQACQTTVSQNSPRQQSSEGAAQTGPFDFKSPLQPGHPQLPKAEQPNQQGAVSSDPQHGTSPFWNADPVMEEPAQPEQPQASAPHEDKEKQIRCGRALLERAMLGPPLPEGDAICSSGMHMALQALSCHCCIHTCWMSQLLCLCCIRLVTWLAKTAALDLLMYNSASVQLFTHTSLDMATCIKHLCSGNCLL